MGRERQAPQWAFSAIRDAVDSVLTRSDDTDQRLANVELLSLCTYLASSLAALGQSLHSHALGYLAAGETERAARCAAIASRFQLAAASGVQDIYTGVAVEPPSRARQLLAHRLPGLLDNLMAIWNELGEV